jgi:paraquat-inducible protein B
VDWSQTPVQLPTIPGQLQVMQAKVMGIINKLDKMPLEQIGDNLRKAIADLDLTLVSARGTLLSAQGTLDNTSTLTGPNSAQIQQLGDTLREVSRAARSLRVLADYLERHPETLVRGKKGEAK